MLQRLCVIIFSIKFNSKTTLTLPVRNVVFFYNGLSKDAAIWSDLEAKRCTLYPNSYTTNNRFLAFFYEKDPSFFPLPVFLHPPSLFAPATKVTYKKYPNPLLVQSPRIKSPGLSRRGSQANPILQHNMAVGWVKYIFCASELRCKPGTDRNPFYILSGTGWWIGSVYSTGFVEERYFETCKILITCLM